MARAEWESTKRLVELALEILKTDQPMTIRQLFYRLVSVSAIANDKPNYRRVIHMMTKAREDGRCPFAWIVDRSRPIYAPDVWTNLHGYLDACKDSYRKDYWSYQPRHVEVWTEKDTIIGSIDSVTDELGVTVRVGRGFLSTTKAHEIAMWFRAQLKPNIVFYLGDHDPSGRCIEEDIQRRILKNGSGPFTLKRLAIHREDIRKFNLPPLRVKDSDSRSGSFRIKHGRECVELDALPPTELRSRLRKAIKSQLDVGEWKRAIDIENAELDSIERIVSQWPTHNVDGF